MAKSKTATPINFDVVIPVTAINAVAVVNEAQASLVQSFTALFQASKINTMIDGWARAGKEFQDTTDTLMFQAILHFHTYGDTVFMNRVINESPAGARVQTKKNWFVKYSPCKWHESEAVFKKNKSNGVALLMDDSDAATPILEAAFLNPYHYEREITKKDFTMESFLKALDAVAKRYAEAKAEDRIEGDIEVLDSLNAKVVAFRKTLAIAA